jgi:hypothetical protein
MRQAAAVVLSTLSLVAACGDMPSPTPPPASHADAPATVSLVELLSARGPSPLRPRTGGPTTAFAMVPDPLDPNTITYTFDDVPPTCAFDDVMADPYDDLDFVVTPRWTGCFSPNGTVSVVPANLAVYEAGNEPLEVRIQLPKVATAASIEFYDFWNEPITLNAYGAGGVLLSTMTATSFSTWTTLSVSAAGIRQIGIVTLQGNTYLDNLKITYTGVAAGPTTKDDCKKGGWETYGFKNQGQCVKFVETGKDSR